MEEIVDMEHLSCVYLQVLDEADHCKCEQCGAPVCGPQCAQGKWHRLECPLLAAAIYKWVKIFLSKLSKYFYLNW